MTDNEQLIANFERIGEAAVRLHVNNGGYNSHVQTIAIEWLEMQKSERLKHSSKAEQIEIARSAKDAAWAAAKAAERAATAAEKANRRATIALIIAVISIAVAAISSWVSHGNSVRSAASSQSLPTKDR